MNELEQLTEAAPLQIDAIVLAAGASARMGTPKQLLPFAGATLLGHAIATARAAGCQRIFVVLGANAEQIAATLGRGELVVENAGWQEGIASSVRAGVAACSASPAAAAALILTCDQPLLDDLAPLVSAFRKNPQLIAAAAYADTVGVPAIFPRTFFPALSMLTGDAGARAVLRSRPESVQAVALRDAAFDIDTPGDYARLSSP